LIDEDELEGTIEAAPFSGRTVRRSGRKSRNAAGNAKDEAPFRPGTPREGESEEEDSAPPSASSKKRATRSPSQPQVTLQVSGDHPMYVNGIETQPDASKPTSSPKKTRRLRGSASIHDAAPYRPGTPVETTEDEQSDASIPESSRRPKTPASATKSTNVEDDTTTPIKTVDFAESTSAATRSRKRKLHLCSPANKDGAAFKDEGEENEDRDEPPTSPTVRDTRSMKKRAVSTKDEPDVPAAEKQDVSVLNDVEEDNPGGAEGRAAGLIKERKGKTAEEEQEVEKDKEKRQTRSWTSWLPFGRK
jgi:hypothetical protein